MKAASYPKTNVLGLTTANGWPGKPLFDRALAAFLLVATAPLGVGVAGLLWWHGQPVWFCQWRIGQGERPFRMRKFCTMRPPAYAGQPDEARLTPLGQWLRRTSLDEWPQLWHVLRGQMSLVGPRPLLPEYLPLYDARQRQRHRLRPGITGLAQVRGRNAAPWVHRLRYDVFYVEHVSCRLDMKILAETLGKVGRAEGIGSPGRATGAPFRGAAHLPESTGQWKS